MDATGRRESGQLIAVLDGAGATLREYIYWGNQQIALISNSTTYYVHNDHLNTPQVITNQNQQVVWMGDYEPFGKIASNVNNSTEIFSRFPGQYLDSETGLYYNYFRDYDPSIGKYIESDPIGLEGGINTYAYVGGNPLMNSDPLGLCTCNNIVVDAIRRNNDPGYGFDGAHAPGLGTNKCNAFVDDVLEGTGVPPRRWGGFGGPIAAGVWGDPNANIPYFPVVNNPQPGDIVAIAYQYANASGHVAIVITPGVSTIGAGGSGSHTTAWPWDSNLSPQGTPVYRRCDCNQ